jgi:MtaA/CmuA family methyltransferase
MVLVLKAARAIKDRFGDSICLGGHVTAPFSSLAYLNGTTEAMTLLYDDPALAQESLEFLLALQLRFALAQLDAGADAIWIGDLNSSSHVISPQHYSDFAYPYVERLVRGIREAGGISFYHQNEPRTHRIAMTAGLMQPGTGGINVGQGADIYAVRNAIGSRVCLLGGLDPWELLRGTPSSLRAQTAELIERIGVFGGYILNTGGQVHVETPEENVRAVIRAARELWEGTEARLAQ